MSAQSTSGHDEEIVAGKYRLERNLGIGGMGRVDAAVNIYSGQRVALKRIYVACMSAQGPADLPPAERRALMDRLLKESKALAQLDHPYIVRLLDCGLTETGDLYIAMELVEGDPLRALIRSAVKQSKHLELDLVLKVGAAVAEAMELAHRKEICHRDLKPENIIVVHGGSAKVVDFGLAKTAVTAPLPIAGDQQSNPANVVGTPLYMAPEQVRGLEVGPRADIYALGVTLYEAITLRTPYDAHEDGATVTVLMAHHVYAEPTPIRNHVPGCPERVSHIISRCLAKNPADRYPHMGSLARDLRAALEEIAPRLNAARSEAARAPDGRAQAVRSDGAPREVRETEPPERVARKASLPFASAIAAPAAAPREVRVTEPMAEPSSPPRPVLPFTAPRPVLPFTPHVVGALLAEGVPLSETGEDTISRSAIPPPPSIPPASAAGDGATVPASEIGEGTPASAGADGTTASVSEIGEGAIPRSANPPPRSTPPPDEAAEVHVGRVVVSCADPDDEVTLERPNGLRAPGPPPSAPTSGPPAGSVADAPETGAVLAASEAEASEPSSAQVGEQQAHDSAGIVTLGPRASEGSSRSGPDFAFESTLSGALKEPAVQENRLPTPIQPAWLRHRKSAAYTVALLAGLSLAVSGMVAVMKVHDASGGGRTANHDGGTSAATPTASASASAASTSTGEAPPPSEPAAPAPPTAMPATTTPPTLVAVSTAQTAPRPPPTIGNQSTERPRGLPVPKSTSQAAKAAPTGSPAPPDPPPPPPPPPPAPTAPHRLFGAEQ